MVMMMMSAIVMLRVAQGKENEKALISTSFVNILMSFNFLILIELGSYNTNFTFVHVWYINVHTVWHVKCRHQASHRVTLQPSSSKGWWQSWPLWWSPEPSGWRWRLDSTRCRNGLSGASRWHTCNVKPVQNAAASGLVLELVITVVNLDVWRGNPRNVTRVTITSKPNSCCFDRCFAFVL